MSMRVTKKKKGQFLHNWSRWLIQELYEKKNTDVGDIFFEAFLVIGPFQRPWVDTGNFDWSILADEDILWPDISNFFLLTMEKLSCTE